MIEYGEYFYRNDKDEKVRNVRIDKVIHNNPATIVFWGDGTKTVVKCQEEDRLGYSERDGLLMCIAKKYFGNTPVIEIPKFEDLVIDKKDSRSIHIKN